MSSRFGSGAFEKIPRWAALANFLVNFTVKRSLEPTVFSPKAAAATATAIDGCEENWMYESGAEAAG